MRRLLDSALRGAALVVTDRRWAAPLSAAALGFGIFAGVAIGPGAAGTLATGAQQIIEIPGSGGEDGQNGGGGGPVASAESAAPFGGAAGGGFEESLPATTSLAPEPVEPSSVPVPEPAAKPEPAAGEAEAEQAEGQVLEGTVVHANSAAGSYTLAIGSGELVSIHAPQLPTPGTVLSAPTRRLANGTFAEAGELEEEKRMATKVSFRGAVTFADPDPVAPAYTVSGRGASLLVHVEPAPGGTAPELPPLGAYVTVTAAIEESEDPEAEEPRAAAATLVQREVEAEPGPPSTYLDLAGIVGEVLPETNQLLLSADDTRASEADLVLAVPKAIDATRLRAGDSHLATATVEPDGSLTLAGITSDERLKGANDTSSAQGDLKRAVASASSAGGTGEGVFGRVSPPTPPPPTTGPAAEARRPYAFSGSGTRVSEIPIRS